jgi:hypothetical protein
VGKVIALLAWYDESPSWLAACVASVAPHVDAIVAVDGAYAQYPDARARSERSQAETIQATAEASGIGCTIHRPQTYWLGGEVEKRTAMFRLGQAHRTSFDDWYWVIDADCVVTQVPKDFRERLAETETNAIEVTLYERRDYVGDHPEVAQVMNLPTCGAQRMPMLFRALKDMQVVNAHYVYGGWDENNEWHYVWGPPALQPDAPTIMENIHVEHRSIWRDLYRRDTAKRYYEIRDELGIERVVPRDENGGYAPVQVTRS